MDGARESRRPEREPLYVLRASPEPSACLLTALFLSLPPLPFFSCPPFRILADYDFAYSDEDEELADEDVEVENAYYGAKASLESGGTRQLEEALSGFVRAASLPSEDPVRWRFRALKQAVKCLGRLGRADEACQAYGEMLELVRSGQIARAPAEKKLASLLDHVAAASTVAGAHHDGGKGSGGAVGEDGGESAEAQEDALAAPFVAENDIWEDIALRGISERCDDPTVGRSETEPSTEPSLTESRSVRPPSAFEGRLPRRLFALTLERLDASAHERLCLRCSVSLAGLDAAAGDVSRALRRLAPLRGRCHDARVRDDPSAAAVLLDAVALSIRIAQIEETSGGTWHRERSEQVPLAEGEASGEGGAAPEALSPTRAASSAPSVPPDLRLPAPGSSPAHLVRRRPPLHVPALLREASALSCVGIPHPRAVAVLREASGRLALLRGRWDDAAEALLEAFRSADETGSPAALRCLRCLVACAPLRASRANPFDSQETRHHRDAAAVRAIREIADAHHAGDVAAFFAWRRAAKRGLDRDRALTAAVNELQRRLQARHLARLANAHARMRLDSLGKELCCADERDDEGKEKEARAGEEMHRERGTSTSVPGNHRSPAPGREDFVPSVDQTSTAAAEGALAVVTAASLRQIEQREGDARGDAAGQRQKRCGCHAKTAAQTHSPDAPIAAAGAGRSASSGGSALHAGGARRLRVSPAEAAIEAAEHPRGPHGEDVSTTDACSFPTTFWGRLGSRSAGARSSPGSAFRGGSAAAGGRALPPARSRPLGARAAARGGDERGFPSSDDEGSAPSPRTLTRLTARERAQLAAFPARLARLKAAEEGEEGEEGEEREQGEEGRRRTQSLSWTPSPRKAAASPGDAAATGPGAAATVDSLETPGAPALLIDELRLAVACIRPGEQANVERWVQDARRARDPFGSGSLDPPSRLPFSGNDSPEEQGLERFHGILDTLANLLETLQRTAQTVATS